jgi:large subunit ribosomal protein L22
MEASTTVRHIRMSPRKLRVVAAMVRGEPVEHAMATLKVMPKKAARVIAKALVSATANAEDRSGGEVEPDNLRIKTITVDGGPTIKRWMPRAMGRANRINHRTSHLTVVVSDEV